MAMLGSGAPLPGSGALVEDPQMQEMVQFSRSLLKKVRVAIAETHRSTVHSEVREEPALKRRLNAAEERPRLRIGAGKDGLH